MTDDKHRLFGDYEQIRIADLLNNVRHIKSKIDLYTYNNNKFRFYVMKI